MRPPGVAPRQMARRRAESDLHENADEAGQRFTAREHNLMGTEITALLYSTFAHCVALHCMATTTTLANWQRSFP